MFKEKVGQCDAWDFGFDIHYVIELGYFLCGTTFRQRGMNELSQGKNVASIKHDSLVMLSTHRTPSIFIDVIACTWICKCKLAYREP